MSLSQRLVALAHQIKAGARPAFATFVSNAKVELIPPSPREIPQVFAGFGQIMRSARTGAWKNLTVREATLNTLVGLEIYFLFFVGECIGKGSLIGYHV
ncbi:ATP synthase subunit g, mitochondrial [Galendromus occidentalis]|uniref:ATP synthase subunit g, mitochondrial n=1 Tax=Galendromus occidentalis TaxID=34638 RepID=A0AAJ6QRA5_9ACAR|nr:ATP synthase subunit g, mitochondrial [Galendromus occidentalis]